MTHTHRSLSFALVSILYLAPACTEPALESLGEVTQAENCGQNVCGSNSPLLGSHEAAEVHQSSVAGGHLENQSGVRLVEFRDPADNPARYQVDGKGELFILDMAGSVTHKGAAVVGATFMLRHVASNTDYELVIVGYHQTLTYWIGAIEFLPSYTMEYTENGLPSPRNLCPGPYDRDPDTNDLYPHSLDVILSTGERYDFDTRDIFDIGAAASNGWTNIACVGDGPSKMLLYRHRPETAANDPHWSSPDQRQALLRMWAADYCGTGTTFTRQGEPLTWRDRFDWMTEAPWTSVEAVWTPDGAACLSSPRAEDWLFPIWKADVESTCSQELGVPVTFPSCDELPFTGMNWTASHAGHYFKTWNP